MLDRWRVDNTELCFTLRSRAEGNTRVLGYESI